MVFLLRFSSKGLWTAVVFCAVFALAFSGGAVFAQSGGYKGLTAPVSRSPGKAQEQGFSGYKGLIPPRGVAAAPAEDSRIQRLVPEPEMPAEQAAVDPKKPQVASAARHPDTRATSAANAKKILSRFAKNSPVLQDVLARGEQAEIEKKSIIHLSSIGTHVAFDALQSGDYYDGMSLVEQGLYPRLDAILQLLESGDFTDENGQPLDPQGRRRVLEKAKENLESLTEVAKVGRIKDNIPSSAKDNSFEANKSAFARVIKEAAFVAQQIEKTL